MGNDFKFSDRQVWANSVAPFQTAPLGKQCRPRSEEQSDHSLHCLPFCLHFLTHYSMVEPYCSNFRIITAIFRVSEFEDF